MKIRRGFVTNSSSSSFIISNNESKIETLLDNNDVLNKYELNTLDVDNILGIFSNGNKVKNFEELFRIYKEFFGLQNQDDIEIMCSGFHRGNLEYYKEELEKNKELIFLESISDCSDLYDYILLLEELLPNLDNYFFERID